MFSFFPKKKNHSADSTFVEHMFVLEAHILFKTLILILTIYFNPQKSIIGTLVYQVLASVWGPSNLQLGHLEKSSLPSKVGNTLGLTAL